ncbi:MAG: hypothetical protein U0746_17250 [Gemmataceae bacterium]
MKYEVVWKDAAEEDLARLWTDAADRDAVTRAAAEIDRLLARDPWGSGESRSGGFRVTFVEPLGVTYRIDEAANAVRIARAFTLG